MKKQSLRFFLSGMMLALITLTCGCANTGSSQQTAAVVQQQTAEGNVYEGRVVGKSYKAQLISLDVGQVDEARILSVQFDNKTSGLEHAAKGLGVMITFEKQGNTIYAVSVKPQPTHMPPGVTEISVAAVKALIDNNENFELIDSRPSARYSVSHLPGAVSIPVCQMQDLLGLLPEDKDKLLVFYCGGPT